jgi:hypothetical protein
VVLLQRGALDFDGLLQFFDLWNGHEIDVVKERMSRPPVVYSILVPSWSMNSSMSGIPQAPYFASEKAGDRRLFPVRV